MRYNADANEWVPSGELYWPDKDSSIDVFGYYPYDNALSAPGAYRFEVEKDQSREPAFGGMCSYEASDLLLASANVAHGSRVDLKFRHVLAGVKVVLTEGEGFTGDEFSKLPKIVTVNNTIRSGEIDIPAGEVNLSGTYDRDIVMNPDAGCYRAVVFPQTVSADKSVIGILIDGTSYTLTREGGMHYMSGRLHNFTIKIDKRSAQGGYTLTLTETSVSDWEADSKSHAFESNSYFVVETFEAGRLAEAIAAAGANYETLRNMKVVGPLNYEDCRFMCDMMPQLSSLNMKEVLFADGRVPDRAFDHNNTITRYVLPDKITVIGGRAFTEIRPRFTLVIPESVVRIENEAFSYIWDQAELVMPGRLEYIGDAAFDHNLAHFELKLPNTLKYIGDGAFEGASNCYGSFSIPSNLEYLGGNSFSNMVGRDMTGEVIIPGGLVKNLNISLGMAYPTRMTIPEGVKVIEYARVPLSTGIILPRSVERIEYEAFFATRVNGPVEFSDNVKYIANRAFCECSISGKLRIPSAIDCIKGGSFYQTNISELEVGDNAIMIESEAFGANNSLRRVQLGKNLEVIGDRAFCECYNIETFVSLAKEPPLAANAFDGGFDFDKTVLEVPAGSVGKYRNAPGWRQFKRITEHRELSADVSEIECLHKGITRSVRVNAEGKCTVTPSASWISVSRNTLEYKDEFDITVASQSESAGGREGYIDITLQGTDYKVRIDVRQINSSMPEDKMIVLHEASTASGRGIPLIILGEGFTASQIADGTYMSVVEETARHFFDISPYSTYREQFAVLTAPACSAESGVSDYSTDRQTKFGANGVEPDARKVRAYVNQVFQSRVAGRAGDVMVIIVNNYDSFSGWYEIADDGFSIASIGWVDGNSAYPYDRRGLVQHYAGGCAFAGLGDESVSHFDHIKSCTCPQCNDLGRFDKMKQRGYFANLTMSGKMSDAPWKDFIFHPAYSNDVDMWEGGYNHLRGVWRSESQSVMGTYIKYFNAISRYTIYKEIKRRAALPASLEDFIVNDNNAH